MEIVREVLPDAVFCTNLYGEMMGLYQNGFLPIPDEVIKIWTDGAADVAAHAAHYAETYYGDARVAELLTGFSSHALQYGVNADDKAGDQYYHFPLRSFLRRLMMGDAQAAFRRS